MSAVTMQQRASEAPVRDWLAFRRVVVKDVAVIHVMVTCVLSTALAGLMHVKKAVSYVTVLTNECIDRLVSIRVV
jgi:hypothetical protein